MVKTNITKMLFGLIILILSFNLVFASNYKDNIQLTTTLLNQNPDPAKPGEYLELRWEVSKPSNSLLTNVTFELIEDYPLVFDELDTSIKKIERWSSQTGSGAFVGNEFYMLYYKVRIADNVLEDNYKIKLKYSYLENNIKTISITKEYNIRIADNKNPHIVIGRISSDPPKLLPNVNENQINIEIINIGDEKAQNLIAELKLPEGFENTYSNSNRLSLGNLIDGESVTATFYLDISSSVKSGVYDTILTVYYNDIDDNTNHLQKVELPVIIEIKNKPLFEITNIKYSSDNIQFGQTAKIIFTIKNIGDKDANAVSLMAFKEASQPFDFIEKSDYIGKLGPGESAEAILQIEADKQGNAKKYLVDLEIRSIDQETVFIQSEIFGLSIKELESSGVLLNIIKYGIIVLVLIGIGYLIGKKKD